jgi:hypothetical protein
MVMIPIRISQSQNFSSLMQITLSPHTRDVVFDIKNRQHTATATHTPSAGFAESHKATSATQKAGSIAGFGFEPAAQPAQGARYTPKRIIRIYTGIRIIKTMQKAGTARAVPARTKRRYHQES